MKKLYIITLLCTLNAFLMFGNDYAIEITGAQYAQANVSLTAIDNFSMEAWVYYTLSEGDNGILYNGYSASNGYGIYAANGTNYLTVLCGGVGYIKTAVVLPADSWHHVAAVRNNGTWTVYLDGGICAITEGASIAPNAPVSGNAKFDIGSQSDSSNHFSGRIDEVRLWNIARSQSEIQATMSSELTGSHSGLVAYYNMNEGSGTTLVDNSSNSNNATIYNGPNWVGGFSISLSTSSIEGDKMDLIIYPNPSTDLVYLESDEKIQNLELFTLNGVKVKVHFQRNSDMKLSLKVDNLQAGLYILKLNTLETSVYRRLIVK